MKTEYLLEVKEAGRAIAALAEDERTFAQAAKAFEAGDRDAFRQALDTRNLLPHAWRICLWFCIWRCTRVCRRICVELPTAPPTPRDLVELTRLLLPLRDNPALLKQFVEAMDRGDSQTLMQIVRELRLERFCFFVCYWICSLRCRRLCLQLAASEREPAAEDPVVEIRDAIEALSVIARDDAVAAKAFELFQAQDLTGFRGLLEELKIFRYCTFVCRFFCHWSCFRICFRLCREIPAVDLTVPELRELGLMLGKLASQDERLTKLHEVLVREDAAAWSDLIGQLNLGRFCYYVCRWICGIRCDLYCWILCPPGCLTTFRYIGAYNVLTQVNSGGDGLTTADKRAFFDTIRLNGVLCKQHAGGPAEYRFEYRVHPAGTWTPVPPDWIVRTVIGQWQSVVPPPPDDVKPYAVKGSAPGDQVTTLTADGWVQVPQESNVNTAAGNFASNGNLINLDTRKMAAWADISIAGVTAGQTTGPGLGQDRLFGLRLRVRRVGMPATEITSGTCGAVAIYDVNYDNVTHKGAWAPELVSNQLGVAMVNVEEIGTGCAKITNAITIKYTAAHPNLGNVSITMDGPGGPYATSLTDDPTATPQDRFGTASVSLPSGTTVASLNKCAYLVKLRVHLLLTTGDSVPDPIGDEVAFCK